MNETVERAQCLHVFARSELVILQIFSRSLGVTPSHDRDFLTLTQNHATEEEDTASIADVHELYQSDFMNGTYRIKSSGTYKIMEDIVFDFNAGDLDYPNEGASWWPMAEQWEEYPGTGQTRDNYYLGFIAGITVEADDVVIDLNDHEIKQSMAFYYQQRFFSCIALKSVAFPLNQGPGFFGMEPVFANNVVIQNGVIGLSSHHGIHGHYNSNVTIANVQVKDFETHGIQMSYFTNLKMENVEIGPSSTVAYLKGMCFQGAPRCVMAWHSKRGDSVRQFTVFSHFD